MMTVEQATNLLTNECEQLGADANDSTGVVRQVVEAHGLSFNAWFVVCCELADRYARCAGYRDQFQRAAAKAVQSSTPESTPREEL